MGGDAELTALEADVSRSAIEAVDRVLADSGAGPTLLAIMVAAIDGRATVDGRSGGLGHPADRALMRELRGRADALLVGSRTLEIERYGNLIDADVRERRLERGQPPHPPVATIVRSGNLSPDIPLLSEPDVEVKVYTELDPPALKADLARIGDGLIVCEGGPHLLAHLMSAGVVDGVLLTLAPYAVGSGLTIVEGLPEAAPLSLRSVQRAGDHLFMHYTPAASS